jgi:hypothetical protein
MVKMHRTTLDAIVEFLGDCLFSEADTMKTEISGLTVVLDPAMQPGVARVFVAGD